MEDPPGERILSQINHETPRNSSLLLLKLFLHYQTTFLQLLSLITLTVFNKILADKNLIQMKS